MRTAVARHGCACSGDGTQGVEPMNGKDLPHQRSWKFFLDVFYGLRGNKVAPREEELLGDDRAVHKVHVSCRMYFLESRSLIKKTLSTISSNHGG